MLEQKTLGKPASFAGVGLHSGNKVSMTFLPAPPNSGIRFRRTDLDSRTEILALIDNVQDTRRSTTLTCGKAKVQTVEHVLATLQGYGIDNAVVELDASEPPVGDGSARVFCRMAREAGIEAQPEKKQIFRLYEPVEFTYGSAVMSAFPYDGLKITCTSEDQGGRFTQLFSLEITPDSWDKELSAARTFCFYEEIEYLIKNGMIRGGSLENAVVIRDDAVLTTEPLRYPEEFVRHKILDILGDLSLAGRPIHAHIIAVKPGHAANCELTRRIHRQMSQPIRAVRTFSPPSQSVTTKPKPMLKPALKTASLQEDAPALSAVEDTAMDIEQIMQILPHRHPFLMVDRVIRIDGNQIMAVKSVSISEHYFQGHFPNRPIMPGVLQLEAMAQVAGILMLKQANNAGKLAYFMAADKVKWRKPVLPGDTLTIRIELLKARGKIGKARGICSVEGETVSEAEITFMLARD